MRHIDSFCHFFPQSIFRLMSATAGGTTDVGKRMQGVRTIYDLDARFRMMDPFDDYTQILSRANSGVLSGPTMPSSGGRPSERIWV